MSRAPFLLAGLLLALSGCGKAPNAAIAPHQIHIVGSSAAFPFSTMVAERLMREEPDAIAPLVRAGGSGEGIARFCGGPGSLHPDIAVVTRAMTADEARRCAAAGVPHVASVPLGATAFVLVRSAHGPDMMLTRAALTRALTSPAVRTWADADPRLPALPVRIEGPAPSPAIADGLFDRLMTHAAALRIRQDGAYVGHGADAELVARAIATTPGAIGILPYPQASQHRDALAMLPLDGVRPTPDTIASGSYPASAPLLLLLKADEAAATPHLPRLLSYYADGLSPGGAFTMQGLIPLSSSDRTQADTLLRSFAKH